MILTNRAKEHARNLARQNWNSFCERLRNTPSTSKTWKLIQGMMDPTSTKRAVTHHLIRAARNYPGTDADLLQALKQKYGAATETSDKPRNSYSGIKNEILEKDIT